METAGLPENQIAIARDGTTTIYEVKFLPSQFGAAEFAEGIEIGASLCVMVVTDRTNWGKKVGVDGILMAT